MDKNSLASKVVKKLKLEADLREDNDCIVCINCGNLVHWAADVCDHCLSDPRKRRSKERG